MSAVNLDWHADRADLLALRFLDREPTADEIELEAVSRYRLESLSHFPFEDRLL